MSELQAQLTEGETLIWSDVPDRAGTRRPGWSLWDWVERGLPLIVFAIIGVALVLLASAPLLEALWARALSALFGIAAFGLVLIIALNILRDHRYWSRSRIAYGLTPERLILYCPVHGETISIFRGSLHSIERKDRERSLHVFHAGDDAAVILRGLPDAAALERLIIETLPPATSEPTS